jgi:hypothetical protein
VSLTYLVFLADSGRNAWIVVAKDVELSRYGAERATGQDLKVVRIEEFASVIAANDRIRAIRKMPIPRRRRTIERDNPEWRDLRTRPPKAELPHLRWDDTDGDEGTGGVREPRPIPLFPRSGAAAKESRGEP